MKSDLRLQTLMAVAALALSMATGYAASQTASNKLASPESFASIAAPDARSAAIFAELGKVLTHPRCVNCHPSDDSPRQRELAELHDPPVTRGDDDRGVGEIGAT